MKRLMMTATTLGLLTASASAQFFPGTTAQPIVVQVGTGATIVSGTGYTTTLKNYNYGVASQATTLSSIAFPSDTTSPRLVLSASATSEGNLTNSVDQNFVVMAGYDAASGTTSVNGATANANRVVGYGALGAGGLTGTAISTIGTQATTYNANNIRSAVSLSGAGSDTWSGGTGGTASTGGVRYTPTNTQVSSSVTNVRSVDIYNNQLFVTSGSGAFVGLNTVGSGLPNASGNTISLLIATGSGSSPYEFVGIRDTRLSTDNLPAGAAGRNLFYIADDRSGTGGGIQRWAWNGTAFVNDYIIRSDATIQGARGLAAVSDPVSGDITLFASRSDGTQLLQFTDTVLLGSAASAEATRIVLATADTNTVFRGVALVVPEPMLGLGAVAMALLVRRRMK